MKMTVLSPMNGVAVPLSSVKDEVFSKKILGDGAAVRPTDGRVCAPCAGVVSMVADTGHAVSIRAAENVQVMVHVGLDTVALEGRPFRVHVAVGDKVKVGAPLITADLKAIEAAGHDTVTPVILCEAGRFTNMKTAVGTVTPTDWLMRLE